MGVGAAADRSPSQVLSLRPALGVQRRSRVPTVPQESLEAYWGELTANAAVDAGASEIAAVTGQKQQQQQQQLEEGEAQAEELQTDVKAEVEVKEVKEGQGKPKANGRVVEGDERRAVLQYLARCRQAAEKVEQRRWVAV